MQKNFEGDDIKSQLRGIVDDRINNYPNMLWDDIIEKLKIYASTTLFGEPKNNMILVIHPRLSRNDVSYVPQHVKPNAIVFCDPGYVEYIPSLIENRAGNMTYKIFQHIIATDERGRVISESTRGYTNALTTHIVHEIHFDWS